jgi:hypothetical protein
MEILVALRDDITSIIPNCVNQVCSKCEAEVHLAPSSLKILKEHPAIEIICQVCFEQDNNLKELDLEVHTEQLKELKELINFRNHN